MKIQSATLILFMFLFGACKTTKQVKKAHPNEYVICPVPQYYVRFGKPRCKSRNLDMITYSYDNSQMNFIKMLGDYMNVKYQLISDLNLACTYYASYGNLKNVITVEVRLSHSSKWKTDTYDIKAVSSKNGELIKVNDLQHENRGNNFPHFYAKELDLVNKRDVLEKIKNDTITLFVENQKYVFISPVRN